MVKRKRTIRVFPKGKVTIKKIRGGHIIKIGRKSFDEVPDRKSALFNAQRIRVLQAEEKLRLLKRKFKRL